MLIKQANLWKLPLLNEGHVIRDWFHCGPLVNFLQDIFLNRMLTCVNEWGVKNAYDECRCYETA